MTRIIAGKYKGRRLTVPEGREVRPTSDRMRERVFSMLMHDRYPDLYGARVADLFAGTGALGLEALSRGANHVTFVEKSPSSLKNLEGNIQTLDVAAATKILKVSARALPDAGVPYDFIFMDPPYHTGLVTPTLASLIASMWIADNGVIICELASDDTLELPDGLQMIDERIQGKQRVVFLIQS